MLFAVLVKLLGNLEVKVGGVGGWGGGVLAEDSGL